MSKPKKNERGGGKMNRLVSLTPLDWRRDTEFGEWSHYSKAADFTITKTINGYELCRGIFDEVATFKTLKNAKTVAELIAAG